MAKLVRADFVKLFQEEATKFGLEIEKQDAVALAKAYESAVENAIYNAKEQGYDSFGIGVGTIKIVDVPEKSGVSKLGGVEKAWTSPAHQTARFKLAEKVKNRLK